MVHPTMVPRPSLAQPAQVGHKTTYTKQAEMGQRKDRRSCRHVLGHLQRKVLVEPARVVRGGVPRSSIQDIAELVLWLWADAVGAVVDREGDADLDAPFDGFLKPANRSTNAK